MTKPSEKIVEYLKNWDKHEKEMPEKAINFERIRGQMTPVELAIIRYLDTEPWRT